MQRVFWFRFPDVPPAKAPRFDFRFRVMGGTALRVVTDAMDLADPCNTYTTDLSGLVQDYLGGWGENNGHSDFIDVDIDTASV